MLDSERYKGQADEMGSVDRIYATFNKDKTSQRISNEENKSSAGQNITSKEKILMKRLTQRKGSGDSNEIQFKLNKQ